MHTYFELRRQSDDLIYFFQRKPTADGQTGYQRQDLDLWIIYKEGFGWVAWDEASQTVMGRPWNVQPDDQTPDYPPEGDWVSKKGAKSYVYTLVFVNPDL